MEIWYDKFKYNCLMVGSRWKLVVWVSSELSFSYFGKKLEGSILNLLEKLLETR